MRKEFTQTKKKNAMLVWVKTDSEVGEDFSQPRKKKFVFYQRAPLQLVNTNSSDLGNINVFFGKVKKKKKTLVNSSVSHYRYQHYVKKDAQERRYIQTHRHRR